MKKKILALAVILAMIVGATNIAIATNTDGSIEFKTGGVIVNPPGDDDGHGDCECCPDCCECGGDCGDGCDCGCPCDCKEVDDYEHFFITHNVEKNLYFGTHELTVFGKFDSAQPVNGTANDPEGHPTTTDGMYTGVEVINRTEDPAKIMVQISKFQVGGTETLKGATLVLVKEAAMTVGEGTPSVNNEIELLEPGVDDVALTVGSGRMVKAAWYGVLMTQPGTAAPGEAQATLTWTLFGSTP